MCLWGSDVWGDCAEVPNTGGVSGSESACRTCAEWEIGWANSAKGGAWLTAAGVLRTAGTGKPGFKVALSSQ